MRPLTPVEIARYGDLLDPALAARVRIREVPLLPPRVSGMTIGRFVLVLDDDDTTGGSALLAHELVHVRQYAERGLVGFLWRYLVDYLKGLVAHRRHRPAYLEIPMEKEARARAEHWGGATPTEGCERSFT